MSSKLHKSTTTVLHEMGLEYPPVAMAVANIPQLAKSGSGVVYGPLSRFPLEADCALVWANPSQAILLGETLLTTGWKSERSEMANFSVGQRAGR